MTIRLQILTPLLLLPALISFVSSAAGQEGIHARSVGVPMGLRRLAPDRWGLVKVEVVNESDQDGSLETEVFLKEHAEQRFVRQVWVPARGVRTSWIPIHLPAELDAGGSLESVGRAGGRGDAALPFRTPIPVARKPLAMAIVRDASGLARGEQVEGIGAVDEPEDAAYEAVLAMRASRHLERTLTMMHERLLPPTFEGWDSIDYLVIAGNALEDDSAAQVAVRQWLSDGGRIWIQLNRVSPETPRRLLGDAFRVEVVDRVPMTRFRLTGPGADVENPLAESEFEQPVELIRAFVDGAEILHEVDGWPASFVIPFGHGEVIVTTLDAHGWMRARTAEDPPYSDPLLYTTYLPTDPMRRLADRIFNKSAPPVLPASLQGDYLTERIGYQVPSRRVVLLILLSFCGSIGVFGGVLIRRQRLEHLAWLTVLAAVLAAGSVVGMGWASRQSVPPTAAQFQWVHVMPQTGDYVASGMVARFEPEQRPVSLSSSHGWRIDPHMPDLTGQIRRFVWTDLDQWHWSGTDLPPGVRLLPTHSTAPLSAPVQAVGRLGRDGFTGRLDAGPFSAPTDAVIAMPFSLPLAANIQADGSFLATPADLLAEGQFMNDALLSDEQRRRQELYAACFANRRGSPVAHVPLLMAWADPLDEQFQWPDDVQQTGATLLSVPLIFERTPPDTPVTIPSSMLDVRAVVGAQGQSLAFDNKTRSWISPNSQSTVTRLRFQLPDAVLPMVVQQATLIIECNVPSRVVEVFVVAEETRESIWRRANPAGVVAIPIDDPQWLTLDARGGLLLEIEVGPLISQVDEQTMGNSGWTIRSTRLEISGRTLPAATESDEPIQ